MKQHYFIFTFILLFSCIASSYESGMHDGGEFVHRITGEHCVSMYPKHINLDELTSQPWGQKREKQVVKNSDFVDMDFESIKDQFPIFDYLVNGQPFIFFDSAATAQMPFVALDEIAQYYARYKANVGRGLYDFAELATDRFELVRSKVAQFIGASEQEIVFTSGATAGINLVAHIWAQHHIHAGDEIVISQVEHNANLIPWQQLAQRKGATLVVVPVNDRGVVDVNTFANYLSQNTKLVAITHQSNILGTVNDVATITQIAHDFGARVLVDAAQSIVHQDIDVDQIGCDFLVFSGHKLFGPTGVGVLYVNQDMFDECVLENFGGGIVFDVTYENAKFKGFPHCLEPGTPAIAQVIGLGAAIDFVQQNINFEQAEAYETSLVLQLTDALSQMPEITLVSPIPDPELGESNSLVTFIVNGVHGYDVAEFLNKCGIAVRAGYHCVQPYFNSKLDSQTSVRVSFSVYNNEAEVDYFIDCMKDFLNNLDTLVPYDGEL